MAKNMEYIRCPRCELNYIHKKDKICPVCKKELEAAYKSGDDADDFDLSMDFDICPVCKTNYIREDEDMCASCARERDIDRALHGDSTLYEDGSVGQDDYENDRLKDEDEFGDMMGISDEEDINSDIDDLDMEMPLDDDMNFDDLGDDDLDDDEDDEDDDDDDDDDDLDDDEDDEDDDDDLDDDDDDDDK